VFDDLIARHWLLSLVAETFDRFLKDDIPTVAAAMSYFLLLAVAPLLQVVNALLGFLGAQVDSSHPIFSSATTSAQASYQQAVAWAGTYAPWVLAALVIFGAVSVFMQFIMALNRIWGSTANRPPAKAYLRQSGLAIALLGVVLAGLIVALVVVLLLAIVVTIAVSVAQAAGIVLPDFGMSLWSRAVVVLVASALLFEVAFTVGPDRKIRWLDSLPGALVTAVLFLFGAGWLSIYLGATQRFNIFGAYQFFVVLVVFIYYSALVALWGAELTRILVLRAVAARGEGEPDELAVEVASER
jgi:membrane protein